MEQKFEILTFKDGDFSLPVNVSPLDDTVWLTKEQISLLFERDRTVISRHILNIFEEGELLKETSCAKNAHQVNGQTHYTYYYNLDVIISVGYRVKSQRGIIFRKWATSILRNFIFQQNSCIECKEKIIDLQSQIYEIKEYQRHELKYEKGEKLQGYLSIKHFLETAKQSIYYR